MKGLISRGTRSSKMYGVYLLVAVLAAMAGCASPAPTPTTAPAAKPATTASAPATSAATTAAAPATSAAAATTAAATKKAIKIGFITDLSGAYKAYGESQQTAIAMAVDEVNAAGGISGSQIQVLTENAILDPGKSVIAMRNLAEQGAVAIIGPISTAEMQTDFPVANELKVVLITAAGNDPALAEKNRPYVFRNFFGPLDPSPTIPAAILKQYPQIKKIAVVWDAKNTGAISSAKGLIASMKSVGVQILNENDPITYNGGDTDFSAQVTKARGMSPDALIVGGGSVEEAGLAREMKRQNLKVPALDGNGIYDPSFIKQAGDASDDWVGTAAFLPDDPAPAVQKFVADFKKRSNGLAPLDVAAAAYDDVKIIAKVLKDAGMSGDTPVQQARDALRDGITKLKDFDGVEGKMNMQASGNFEKQPFAVYVKGGKFVVIK